MRFTRQASSSTLSMRAMARPEKFDQVRAFFQGLVLCPAACPYIWHGRDIFGMCQPASPKGYLNTADTHFSSFW